MQGCLGAITAKELHLYSILLLQEGQFLKNHMEKPLELMISGRLAYISMYLHIEQHRGRLHSICYRVPRPPPHMAELVNHQTFNE